MVRLVRERDPVEVPAGEAASAVAQSESRALRLAPDRKSIRLAVATTSPLRLEGSIRAWRSISGMRVVAGLSRKEDVIALLGEPGRVDVLVCPLGFWLAVYASVAADERNSMLADVAVVVTGPDDPAALRDALWHGAAAFVPSSCGFDDLVTAVQAGAKGYHCYPRTVAPAATPHDGAGGAWETFAASHVHVLTPRELEVVRLVADGHADKEIAAAVNLSVRTVQGLVSAALSKLGVDSRLQMALLVWRGRDGARV